MENINLLLMKVQISSNDIEQEVFQDIIYMAKKSCSGDNLLAFDQIVEELWRHLSNTFSEFDNQLLCSTCFFSVLVKSRNKDFYLNEICNIIDHVLLSYNTNFSDNKSKGNNPMAISLIYGMFQSSFFCNEFEYNSVKSLSWETLLQKSFCLLTHLAYEYSQYTFIVFKTISCFKKVIGTDFEKVVFKTENQTKLLHMTNHNWENPVTGVRSLNRSVFRTLILVFDTNTYNFILEEINQFYWNKAKFLMITEVIEEFNGNIEDFVNSYNWICGLLYSLGKTGLVSAGADMYYAILKNIKTYECWMSLFLDDVVKILSGPSVKAIEHFYNYWCLSTLKKFPLLFDTIVEKLKLKQDSKTNLYSFLFLLKQGNKLGLINKIWTEFNADEKVVTILNNIEHLDPNIRMIIFEIICVSNNKILPTETEYNKVLNFLWNNLNSDCTILRLSMLNSFSSLLLKLQKIFVNGLQKLGEDNILQMRSFYKNLQILIKKSLNLNGNYQRRITTVKILKLLLIHTTEIQKKQNQKETITLNKFLDDQGDWVLCDEDFVQKLLTLLKDPANDVHECVSQILSTYFSKLLIDTSILQRLIDEGKKCLSSKFFYDISCGQLMFKLIIHILMKTDVEAEFKNIQEIYNFAYNELTDNYQENTLCLIQNGKQLHSYISLICVILEACTKHLYALHISTNNLLKLVDILNCISNQFALEKDTLVSSDFSKMNEIVEVIITNAGYNPENDDDIKISGLHQLVLNCLWLNLKSSCELLSLIIQYNSDNLQICSQCLNGITNVLETSRHKGAIEAAGNALGNSIKFLTSQPKKSDASQLPFILLEKKLNELIFEAIGTASVTRRGAGLSIMVHKIVSNDMQKSKPLFHYIMKVLLQVCNSSDESTNSVSENEKDVPKAIYIHFLTKIVMDSSLASDTMFYATELAEIVFENLTDSHWQIRNAALQLYGALVPKLIGQKKASAISDESVATVACDEFRTHFPKLWTFIVQQIQKQCDNCDIQSHSNLVPILNILANVAKRYNFSNDHSHLENLTKSLIKLLGSPLHIVRRLTAKAITNLTSVTILNDVDIENENITENYLHGVLLLILTFNNRGEKWEKKLLFTKDILSLRNKHSFLTKACSERIIDNIYLQPLDIIQRTLDVVPKEKYEPGIYLWANARIEKCIIKATWNCIAEMVKILLKCNNLEQYLEVLCTRVKSDEIIPEDVALEITQILITSDKHYNTSIIWKILYQISLQYSLNSFININLINLCVPNKNLHRNRYLLPLLARELSKSGDNYGLVQISSVLYNQCLDGADLDIRHILVIANNELALKFCNFTDDIKINAIKTAIILLQDEDEDIRNEAVHFYKIIMLEKEPVQPYICLNKIIDVKFMQSIFIDYISSVKIVYDDLLRYVNSIKLNDADDFNPFGNNMKNIYLEVNVLEQLLNNLNAE